MDNLLQWIRRLKVAEVLDLRFIKLFFLLISFSGFSQSAKIDSIKVLLSEVSQKDTLYCYQLGKLAYYENHPEQKKKYSLDLLEVSRKINYISGIYNGYYYLGFAEKYLGNLTKSLDAFFSSLAYAEEISYRTKCEVLTAIADVYKRNTDYKNAVNYYHLAIRTLSLDELNIREKETLGISFLNLGDLYLTTKDLDSALFYSGEARQIFETIDRDVSRTGLAFSVGNIGLVYAEMGQHGLAEHNIKIAITQLAQQKDYYAISIYYTYMADIYLEKNDLKKALQYAKDSYDMAREYGLKEQIRDASLKLYELYKVAGDYSTALDYHVEYIAYKDSITNRESIQQMADLRTAYEVGQKQAEVDLLTVEKQNQRIILLAVAGFAFILVILAFVIYRFYQSKARINQVLETQKQKLERVNQTKDKFFSIISHDLRGPVSSFMGISRMIKHFVNTKDTNQLLEVADDIDNSVRRLSTLLDNLLTWAMQQQGSFPYVPEKLNFNEMADELVQTLDTMAGAKNIRLFAEFDGPVILWADKNTTMTITRNLVSNSLKFTPENGEVKITAREQGKYAEISISDTGVGIPKEKLEALFKLQAKKSTFGTSGEKGLGLGLQLVNEFIEMNGGRIKVDSKEGEGSTFRVWLPLFESVGVTVKAV